MKYMFHYGMVYCCMELLPLQRRTLIRLRTRTRTLYVMIHMFEIQKNELKE